MADRYSATTEGGKRAEETEKEYQQRMKQAQNRTRENAVDATNAASRLRNIIRGKQN
jgi:hypothetical protein